MCLKYFPKLRYSTNWGQNPWSLLFSLPPSEKQVVDSKLTWQGMEYKEKYAAAKIRQVFVEDPNTALPKSLHCIIAEIIMYS